MMSCMLHFVLCWPFAMGTLIPVFRDAGNDWETIVSKAHLVEVFRTLGQLHVLDDTDTPKNDLMINLYLYFSQIGVGSEKLNIQMGLVKQQGYIRWMYESTSWKIQLNACEKDFDVAPVAASDGSFHWTLLLSSTHVYLKCNSVVVAVLDNGDCLAETEFERVGGWELVNMEGLQIYFENMKNVASCSMPSYKYKSEGVIGVKKLTTAEDCRYNCQYLDRCKTATIRLSENACYLYSDYGGDAVYVNEITNSTDLRYLNFLYGDYISLELDCFAQKDNPCWRKDVRFDSGISEIEPTSITNCADRTYTDESAIMWDPVNGYCAFVEDAYVNMAETSPAPGFLLLYTMCSDMQIDTNYNACYEYGVMLNGDVIAETSFQKPYDCRDACNAMVNCTGWSGITAIKKCYLYSGIVYKVSFPQAISGIYRCNTDFVQVPTNNRVVEPVATSFNLLTSAKPDLLNLLLTVDDEKRTLHVNQLGDVELDYTIEFYTQRQFEEFDIRIEGCSAVYNYTNSPCSPHKTTNQFGVSIILLSGTLSLSMMCGKTDADMVIFFTKDDLSTDCGWTITSWDAFKFEGFHAADSYSIDLPECTSLYPYWDNLKTETAFPIVSGAVIEVTCETGYSLEGSNTVTCDIGTAYTFTEQPACIGSVWSEWGTPSACSVTCGGGTRSYSRTCIPPLNGVAECVGDATKVEACSLTECPAASEAAAPTGATQPSTSS